MREITGTCDRVLEIDLAARSCRVTAISGRDRRMLLGGKGLALKLYGDRVPPGTEPYAPENLLIFMLGPLTGSGAPCSGRFAGVTKSPLTGLMLSCSCGGPFGLALRSAGFEGLIIGGAAADPVILRIDAEGARFESAEALWGLDTRETQERIAGGGEAGMLAIGPAGENRVRFANIASGRRFLGRGGMGAVMGAKRLKAVVVRKERFRFVPREPALFEAAVRRANRQIDANHFTGDLYRRFGTAANVNLCRRGAILPVENFRRGAPPEAEAVSGEAMRVRYRTRPRTCRPCRILCGHEGTHPDGTVHPVPEYETVALLGTNLGVFDPDRISAWNDLCGRMGLDTISTGGVIAWAMEADARGIFRSGLRFGSTEGVSETILAIAHRRGIGALLAEGTRRLAERHGGADFAIQVKGLEMAGYDPRGAFGQGLAYAVANRGACHLAATTFALEVFLGLLDPLTTRAKAPFVAFFENLFAAVNCLHLCQFTTFAYILEEPLVKHTPRALLKPTMQYLPAIARRLILVPTLTRLLRGAAGLDLGTRGLLEVGERVHTLERHMNTREGVSAADDTLPARFLREGRRVPLEALLDDYYRERGWDARGIPEPRTLARLGLG